MPMPSEIHDVDTLRNKIIGLGEKSMRKSYYPELQQRISELEKANADMIREISERQISQEKERAAEEKFSTLFNAMTEMVVIHELVFDENGVPCDYRILQCNGAFTDITGIPVQNAVGLLGSVVYGQNPPPYLDEYSRVAISGVPFVYTDFYAPMDKFFNISAVSPAKNMFATITTDVSEIQQIKERMIMKNKELENYLYVASHDLRSPLVNIQGFSARLKKQVAEISGSFSAAEWGTAAHDDKILAVTLLLEEGIPKTLDFIFTNVAKMDKLINGLLHISRTGRISMNVSLVDMNKVIRAVLDSFAFQLEQAHAETKIGDLPDCYGDENLLNQLFSNIVSNAIKYRDAVRPLIITIGCTARHRRNQYFISDTGIGIAKRYCDRVWDVFYRIDWDGAAPGDGVGLSIVKRIVDKHTGKTWLESEEGQGSTFFVELPAEPFSAIE